MPKALPAQPHIDWLKKTAKERLAALREGDPGAKLHEAQLALANEYGFSSWRTLKARVDASSLDGRIIAAAKEGRAQELDRLLTKHPRKITITGSNWNRPLLHIAAAENHLDCVDVLLRHGFDIAIRDAFDNATALNWAAQHGSLEMVQRLIDAGTDIDGEGDEHQIGAIGWATCFKEVRKDVADLLLARGAKPTIFSAVALGRDDLVRDLVTADPQLLRTRKMSRFEHYRTPLHLAVLKNRPKMVRLLMELGADPSAKDSRGYTPLGFTTAKTHPDITAALVAAGASLNERTENRFEHVVPILTVKDMAASIAYYEGKLGFEKKWEWGDPTDFACVRRQQVELFLSFIPQGGPRAWLAVFVRDVDALYETYQKAGAIIRKAPADYPWGNREMTVEDLDGNSFRVSGDGGGENRSDHEDQEG